MVIISAGCTPLFTVMVQADNRRKKAGHLTGEA